MWSMVKTPLTVSWTTLGRKYKRSCYVWRWIHIPANNIKHLPWLEGPSKNSRWLGFMYQFHILMRYIRCSKSQRDVGCFAKFEIDALVWDGWGCRGQVPQSPWCSLPMFPWPVRLSNCIEAQQEPTNYHMACPPPDFKSWCIRDICIAYLFM